jgi:monofunctional biosynthetic peptidoglycan transglycosylase
LIRWLFNTKPNTSSLSFGGIIKRIVVVLIVYAICYQLWVFIHIWWWIDHNPSISAFMRERQAVIQEEKPNAEIKYTWVSYKRISSHLKRAVIASEDAKFVNHEGFDWDGIENAFEKNLKKGKIVAGGSTISQQLAKNLFLSSQRTPWRKGQEVIITLMLEKMMDKKRIFEIYLNVIEWGNGVFGAEAASRHYYRTSAANLSKTQAAKLAAMIPNPRFYDKHRNTRYLNRHTARIQARMRLVQIP